jgi:hypothetical protein
LFVREGAILTLGDVLKVNNNWTPDWKPRLRIEVYPGMATSRFEYYTGGKIVPITCANENGTIAVTFGETGVPGDVVVFCSAPEEVKLNSMALATGAGYSYDTGAQRLTVPYQGGVKLELAGARSLFAAETVPGKR